MAIRPAYPATVAAWAAAAPARHVDPDVVEVVHPHPAALRAETLEARLGDAAVAADSTAEVATAVVALDAALDVAVEQAVAQVADQIAGCFLGAVSVRYHLALATQWAPGAPTQALGALRAALETQE
mmetsp:Transcript_60832/g.128736  ORF Transcript_60832/g.128736 Transcript_60832/m.128736 type:complete len:127 (+) Transcript_60832:295-675(+)